MLLTDSIPSYDEDYLDSQDIFFYQFNEIDFYVEDVEQEELYKEILSKLLPFKIKQVFPLGGKLKVIEKAKVNNNVKRKIFLVDKDFDDLHESIVKIPNLFYLDKYSIENFLITKESFLAFLKDELPKKSIDELEKVLDFESLFELSIKELTKLFVSFFLIQKLGLPMENCSCSIDRFIKEKSDYEIDEQKCTEYLNEIQLYCDLFGLNIVVNEQMTNLLDKYKTVQEAEPHIPGKHLLALFLKKTSELLRLGRMPNKDSLYFRLARNSTFNNLSGVKTGILDYINN
jgi:hypothetical protein